ncbi:hypothetical protein HORIV_09290 [Vreelandella olivaria]|uniref:Quinate/shikimate 5-dehydrogenase/glutamyl-tRNA reductase domain-containing protein n=1 Tax=Vreelandella olivaria TaxID=390919 RepID=A0ABM7GDN7_9GAMM|nr:hypothetical protein HORIV_09290 [Halomonas olivaria]
MRDLAYHRVALAGKRILVVGAGGAVRGILEPLLAEQPSEIVVVNRTAAKAEQLASDFADLGSIHGGGFETVNGTFDVVINGTSASLSGDLPPLPDTLFNANAWAYDMMYGAEPTVFLQWAGPRARNCWTVWACWSNRPPSRFFCGAMYALKPRPCAKCCGNNYSS